MRMMPALCILVLPPALAVCALGAPPASATAIPPGARYACPMETHPDATDPAQRGPYFSAEPGKCPRCGMTLKPLDEVPWALALKAAEGAEVAYTCPDHPYVFSSQQGKCPRCGKPLEPFKVMYTCPNPQHAAVIRLHPGQCPQDGRPLVSFRGVWLSEDMASRNVPPDPAAAEDAAYRCPVHPLVHSDRPGSCTICARELEPAKEVALESASGVPAGAKYVCPMQKCHTFSAEPGECPKCGMDLKPIAEVSWARELARAAASQPAGGDYVCPMHPEQRSAEPGRCEICGMLLVREEDLPHPQTAPQAVQVQMDHLMEHYLELQQSFAADRVTGAAKQALGLVAAADAIEKQLHQPGVELPDTFKAALERLRSAAVKLRGENLAESRVAFVDLSAAMRTMVERVRPSRERYARIYIFHCPMSKGDWLQTTPVMKNPYYGFDMLKCGQPVETR